MNVYTDIFGHTTASFTHLCCDEHGHEYAGRGYSHVGPGDSHVHFDQYTVDVHTHDGGSEPHEHETSDDLA